MKTSVILSLALALAAASHPFAGGAAASEPKAAIDKPAPDFTLTDVTGKKHKLSDYEGKTVVLEWNNWDCPFVKKHYGSGNMQKLQSHYTGKDVVWLTICSSGPGKQGYYDSKGHVERIKKHEGNATAFLADVDGKVGRMYGAKTTPHMYIIDPGGVLVYAGAIDDKPSTRQSDVKEARNYVRENLDAVLADKPVPVKSSKPYGCSVKYK